MTDNSFLWRRLNKIVPAYLVWSMIYWLAFSRQGSVTGQTNYHLYLNGAASGMEIPKLELRGL